MSSVEKWQIGTSIVLGVIALIGAASWKMFKWYRAKKSKYENRLLENLGILLAEFETQKKSSTVDEATKMEFQQYCVRFTQLIIRINNEDLGLAELRRLDKKYIARTKFIQKGLEILEKS